MHPLQGNLGKESVIRKLLFVVVLLGSLTLLAACGGAPATGWSAAVVANGTVYYGGTDGGFYALDASTGQEKWRYPSDRSKTLGSIYGQPLFDNGTLYFGAMDGVLYALDAATGNLKASFDATAAAADRRGIISSPVLSNGVIYFGANDHNFYALNEADLKPKWTFTANEKIWGDALVDNGTVYFGSLDHHLYALDLDGNKKWSFDAGGMIVGRPAIANGVVYVGALNYLIAVDAANGQKKWPLQLEPDHWIWSNLTLENNVLYFGELGGLVHAVDVTTQKEKWSKPFSAGAPVRSGVMIAGNLAYFAGGNKIYGLNKDTGAVQSPYPYKVAGTVYATPTVDGGSLYVATQAHWFYALNADNADKKWAFDQSQHKPGDPPQQ